MTAEQTITVYEPSAGEHISEAARAMVKLANETGCEVTARFNDMELRAEPGGDAETIAAEYSAAMERSAEAYRNSEEGRRAAREAEERAKIAAQAEAEGILPFQFRDAEAEALWQQGLANNADDYGQATFRYAARWAAWMEQMLRDGEALAAAVKATEFAVDLEGISGYMASCARRILEAVWIHGEALKAEVEEEDADG